MIKMQKKLILVLVSFLILFIAGCGSSSNNSSTGSSTNTPTDPNTVFQIIDSAQFSMPYKKTYNLTGSDNKGNTYKWDKIEEREAETTFLNEKAIVLKKTGTFTIVNTGQTATIIDYEYYTNDINNFKVLGDNNEIISTTASIIPKTAKIGNSGNVGTYIKKNGRKITSTWELKDGMNGKALLVQNNSVLDSSGKFDYSSIQTNLIDINGVVSSYTLEEKQADGTIYKFSGTVK